MIRSFITALLAALALSCFAANAFAATDVNKASQAELESIRGVGPSLAGKILDARKTGSFKGWPDLVERVRGVGPASAARLSTAGLTVDGAVFDAKALPAKDKGAKRSAKANADGQAAKPEKVKKAKSDSAGKA